MVFVIKSTTQKRIAQDLRKEICDKNHTARLSKIWAVKNVDPHSSWGCIFYWERLSFSLLNSWANNSGIQYDIAHIASSISCPLFSGLFFCLNPPKSGVFSVEVKRYSLWLLNNQKALITWTYRASSSSALILFLPVRYCYCSQHGLSGSELKGAWQGGFPSDSVPAQLSYL